MPWSPIPDPGVDWAAVSTSPQLIAQYIAALNERREIFALGARSAPSPGQFALLVTAGAGLQNWARLQVETEALRTHFVRRTGPDGDDLAYNGRRQIHGWDAGAGVSALSKTGTTATLTLNVNPPVIPAFTVQEMPFLAGDVLYVTGSLQRQYRGFHTITAITDTEISYAIPASAPNPLGSASVSLAFPIRGAGAAGWRRKRPREIYRLSQSGTAGQRALFVRYAGSLFYACEESDPLFGTFVQTPAGETQYNGLVFEHDGTRWVEAPEVDPDLLELLGTARPGDYFGPWILEDLQTAMNQLTVTLAASTCPRGAIGQWPAWVTNQTSITYAFEQPFDGVVGRRSGHGADYAEALSLFLASGTANSGFVQRFTYTYSVSAFSVPRWAIEAWASRGKIVNTLNPSSRTRQFSAMGMVFRGVANAIFDDFGDFGGIEEYTFADMASITSSGLGDGTILDIVYSNLSPPPAAPAFNGLVYGYEVWPFALMDWAVAGGFEYQ